MTVRDHISEGVNRARVELEVRRSVRPLVVYALGLGLMAACALYIAGNLPGGGGFTAVREVRFAVPDAAGVVAGRAEVRFKGIPAGKITEVDYQDGKPLLTAEIEKERGPIYRDARAELRPNTPLQDMYLDIVDRGSARSGPADRGGPLPASQTATGVHVSEVLQVFDGHTSQRLRTLVDQFGNGLSGEGASLQTAFAELVPLLRTADRLGRQVTVRERRTRRLMHNFATLTGELGRRERQLRTLVTAGGRTLSTLEAGAPDLDATLRTLPPALTRLDSSLTALGNVLPDVDQALRALDPAVNALPAALSATRSLSRDAGPALAAARPSVRSLLPLSRQVRPLSANLSRALRALQPQAGPFDRVTLALSKCGYTLERFFLWTQSVFALGDTRGEAPRGDAALGLDSTGVTADPRTSSAPACAGGELLRGAPAKEFHP